MPVVLSAFMSITCNILPGLKGFAVGLRDEGGLITLLCGVGGDGGVYHLDDVIPPFVGMVSTVQSRVSTSSGRSIRSNLKDVSNRV